MGTETRPERRKYPNRRQHLTVPEHAFEIVDRKYQSKKPSDEELKQAKFTGGEPVRRAVIAVFDRLDGKTLDNPEKVEKLREAFDRGIAIWEKAGLFTPEREQAGYLKPDFDRDCSPYITQEIVDMTQCGADINRGYFTPVFAPKDVPFYDKDPNKLSYIQLLEDALFRALCGTAGGKHPNTLLVGPQKKIVGANAIKLDDMVSVSKYFEEYDVLYDVKNLHGHSIYPENDISGVSEKDMLEKLTGNEKRIGGVIRFERDGLIRPADIDKKTNNMDAERFSAELPNLLHPYVEPQDMKEAIAHTIYCLETSGWIPDFEGGSGSAYNSNLAIKNCIPHVSWTDERIIPVLGWSMHDGRFMVKICTARLEYSFDGIRVGIRMRDSSDQH